MSGKQLLIVENLVSKNGKLHPVQDAMVKFHGSQCGFCTPGFVMSLFSMFKKNSKFKNDEIEHKNIAYEAGATNKGLYGALDKIIKTGSRIAITISEKI